MYISSNEKPLRNEVHVMKDVQKGLFVEDGKSSLRILAEFPFGLINKKRYEIHDNLRTILKGGGR